MARKSTPAGSTSRVRDLARVELGAQNEDTFARLNGEPATAIGNFVSPGANAVRTAAGLNATLDKLRAPFPDGLKAALSSVVELLHI